jgi:hypothetical protein
MPFTFLNIIHGGRKPAPNGSQQPQPDEPIFLSDEQVLCADRTPSPASIPCRVVWSRQVTHLGKSLRGNARNPTNRVPCQTNEYYVQIGPFAQPPPRAAGDGAGRSPTLEIAKRTERENVNECSPKNYAHWSMVVRGLDQARSLTHRSTTPHPAACSHPRPAFGCRSKGDQPAPAYRLGVEGPKDGEIKEKVERGQAKSGS